jgi:dTDP-4-dehydrorhamnose reductase
LALKLAELLAARVYGVFHVTGGGECSWYEFAEAIVQLGGYPQVRVTAITTQECGRLAPRPAFSLLENRRLAEIKLGTLPHWKEGLAQYLDELSCAGEFGTHAPKPQGAPTVREVTKQ